MKTHRTYSEPQLRNLANTQPLELRIALHQLLGAKKIHAIIDKGRQKFQFGPAPDALAASNNQAVFQDVREESGTVLIRELSPGRRVVKFGADWHPTSALKTKIRSFGASSLISL